MVGTTFDAVITFGFDWMVFGVDGTGNTAGLANCASNELTTPRLGARNDVTERDTIVGIGDAVLPEFCSNCLSRTFCESSDLWGTMVMVEYLQLSIVAVLSLDGFAFVCTDADVEADVDTDESSFSSLIAFACSRL